MRLEKLENVNRYHGQKSNHETGHRLDKKLYEEQHEFNLKVLCHFENVSSLEGNNGKADIKTCMSLIKEWNKFLVLANSFGKDVALNYSKEPLAEDSKKEGKIKKKKHLKSKLKPRRRYLTPVRKQSPCIRVSCRFTCTFSADLQSESPVGNLRGRHIILGSA